MTSPHMSRDAREKLLGLSSEEFAKGLDPEARVLFQRIDLGIDIEAWLAGHPIGQFFAAMVDAERESAMEALVAAMRDRPDDHALHRKHHTRVVMCDMFATWLADAIQIGREAEEQLRAMETAGST